MNRWDEIQATARDVADWVCNDPADRNKMADDLIKLVCLVAEGIGKGVAIDGESNIGDPDDDSAHTRYLVGERIQDSARTVREEAVGADLERYGRSGLKPVWTSRRARNEIRPGYFTVGFVRDAVDRALAAIADPAPAATPTQHTWVTATDGDTGATLDWQHCGVCGIRKCDGGCGDASVGATPAVDCAVHGDDIARRCNG